MGVESPFEIKIDPLLTILVPTYNRAARVKTLLGYLLPLVESYSGRIEIVVSNNKSTDGTKSALSNFRSPFLRVVNRDVHLPTAEENIFNSIGLCRGEYVWIHGDDDIANPDTIDFAIELLESKAHDFVVFNSQFIDDEGKLTGGWLVHMHGDVVVQDFVKGACALGLTSCFAGISNAIQRREYLLATDWHEILDHAIIYAHVAWRLLAFKGKKITIVNRPLVHYRVHNDAALGEHFRKVAERINVPDFHFWTFGTMHLFRYLEDRGAIAKREIASLSEVQRDGKRFRLLDNVVGMLYQQAMLSSTEGGRNGINPRQLEEFCDWLLSIDPSYFELLEIIKESSLPASGRSKKQSRHSIPYLLEKERPIKLADAFDRLRAGRLVSNNPMIGVIGRFSHFLIYKHTSGFIAFNERLSVDRQKCLTSIDFDPADPSVLCAKSQPELRVLIDLEIERERAREEETLLDEFLTNRQRQSAPLVEGPVGSSRDPEYVSAVGLKLPAHVSLEIGKLLCTFGLKRVGARFYNAGLDRISAQT